MNKNVTLDLSLLHDDHSGQAGNGTPFGLAVICCALTAFLFGMADGHRPRLPAPKLLSAAKFSTFLPRFRTPLVSGNHIVVSEHHDATGVVTHEEWMKDGKYDRADGPAIITRDRDSGAIALETWYKDGKLNRADGPANIQYNTRGKVIEEE